MNWKADLREDIQTNYMSFINAESRDIILLYPRSLRIYTYWILSAVLLMLIYIMFLFNLPSAVSGRIILQKQRKATLIAAAIPSDLLRPGNWERFYINEPAGSGNNPVQGLVTEVRHIGKTDSVEIDILFDQSVLKHIENNNNNNSNLTACILLNRKGIFHQILDWKN